MAKSQLAWGRADVTDGPRSFLMQLMSDASSLMQASTHHIYESQMDFEWKFIKGKTDIWSKSDMMEVIV